MLLELWAEMAAFIGGILTWKKNQTVWFSDKDSWQFLEKEWNEPKPLRKTPDAICRHQTTLNFKWKLGFEETSTTVSLKCVTFSDFSDSEDLILVNMIS